MASKILTPKQEAANASTDPERLQELAEMSLDLTKLVAKNPNTPPDLLKELGSHSDARIRKHVAQNPNTSTEVLLKLAGQFPEQLLDNPVFDLLLLEHPDFLTHLSESAMRSLLKRDRVPISFLKWATHHRSREVQMSVAMNPITPKPVLEILVQSQYSPVSEAAQLHVNWLGEMNHGWDIAAQTAMEAIDDYTLDRNEDQETALWHLKVVPEFLLPILPVKVRLSIAKNPDTLIRLLEKFANDDNNEILCAVVENPNTTEDILKTIMDDSDEYIRKLVMFNPSFSWSAFQEFQKQWNIIENLDATSEELLLIKDSSWKTIQLGVARHSRTPIQILETWMDSEDYKLRLNIALNLNSSKKVLQRLAKDGDWIVRWGVAQNLSTPIVILEQLTQDEDSIVRDAASDNLDHFSKTNFRTSAILFNPMMIPRKRHESSSVKRTQYVSEVLDKVRQSYMQTVSITGLSEVSQTVRHGNWSYRIYLTPLNIPSFILEQLANSQEDADRRQAAKHPRTPQHLLASLATDKDSLTRSYVAGNISTPINLLLQLIGDTDDGVREATLENLKRHISNSDISDDFLIKLAPLQDWRIQLMIARHPKSSGLVLEQLSQAQDWRVRWVVAQHPHAPTTALTRLESDKNLQVRQTANQALGNTTPQTTDLTSLCKDVSAQDIPTSDLSIDLGKYGKSSTPSLSRLIVFLHPLAPIELLAKNVRSLCWLERYAIAQNPNTPSAILKILANDGNRIVRATAKNSFSKG